MTYRKPVPILQFVATSGPLGGADRQVIGYLRHADRNRFASRVHVLTDDPTNCALVEAARALGIAVSWQVNRGPFDWSAIPNVVALLREHGVGLLCAHGDKAHLLGLFAARWVGVPVLAAVHGWTGETLRVKSYNWLDRRILPRMDAVVTVSEEQRDRLLRLGVPPGSVRAIHNAIDVQEARQSAGHTVREELGLSRHDLIVVAVGRLSPEKGHRDLLRAAQMAHPRVPAHYVFIGDGPARPALEVAARASGISSYIHFLGARRYVPALLRGADVFALPSLSEGLPNAILEAMAVGLPVVATAVGGVREVVIDGETGLLTRPRDPADLSERLVQLLCSSATQRLQLGEAGRERVIRHFSPVEHAAKLESLYLEAITRSRARRAGARSKDRPRG